MYNKFLVSDDWISSGLCTRLILTVPCFFVSMWLKKRKMCLTLHIFDWLSSASALINRTQFQRNQKSEQRMFSFRNFHLIKIDSQHDASKYTAEINQQSMELTTVRCMQSLSRYEKQAIQIRVKFSFKINICIWSCRPDQWLRLRRMFAFDSQKMRWIFHRWMSRGYTRICIGGDVLTHPLGILPVDLFGFANALIDAPIQLYAVWFGVAAVRFHSFIDFHTCRSMWRGTTD